MHEDDDPRPNSPEDLGWTPQALERRPPPINLPRIDRRTTTMAKTTTPETEIQKEEGARGFAPFLQQVDDGELHLEVSKTTQELIGDLYAYANKYQRDGKGTLTLTLNFAVHGNGGISVVGDVKTKKPKTPRAPSMFFRTPGNNLSLENPRQTKLPLREVPAAPSDIPREVNHEGAPRAL
jgi:hypothetical protein